ncbi:MAG: hypothetical protein JW750_00645 [Anaerolineaceae bacterium]|nr:hypothetical protein [Anaerolineaceae bacterium]
MTTPNLPPKRPWAVRWLIIGFSAAALVGWFRAADILRNGAVYREWIPNLPVTYIALTGILWALISAGSAVLLFFRRAWVPVWIRIHTLALTLLSWIDQLIFAQSEIRWSNLPFRLLLNALIAGGVLFLLARKRSRAYFHLPAVPIQNHKEENA